MNKGIGGENFESLQARMYKIENSVCRERWNYAPVPFEVVEHVDEAYPFTLVTGHLMQHSGALSLLSKNLSNVVPEAIVQINETDAETYGIKDGDAIKVQSRRGSITVKANVTDAIIEGMLFAPMYFHQGRFNTLTYEYDGGASPLVAVNISKA